MYHEGVAYAMSKKKSHEKNTENEEPVIEKDVSGEQNSEETATEETAGAVTSDDSASEENGEASEKSADETIAQLQEEVQNANERYIRLMAEFDNYKKRTSREYERMVESANEKLMLELIDVRETFERALKHTENADLQNFVDGTKLIFNKLDGVLAANGLTPFADIGDEFDPQLHDAMLKQPHPELDEDHIVDIFEKGYKLKERVIKHARVIVSAGAPEETEATTEKE